MKKVLIVDDDPEWMYDYYEPVLQKAGYDYTLFRYYYDEMLSRLPTERFDVAIIDGLHGGWRKAVKMVNADRIILHTSNLHYPSECRDGDYPGVEVLDKINKSQLRRIIEGGD